MRSNLVFVCYDQRCARKAVTGLSKQRKKANRTAADVVYREMKRQILTLQLAPGRVLEEHSILRKLGFSRTPFREACMRLKEEGWLLSISRRGYLVAPITLEDIMDVYELRLIIETACAQIAVARATEKDIECLEEIITAENQQGSKIREALVRLNYRFHISLAELTRNSKIVRNMESVLEQVERFDWMLSRYNPVVSWVKHSQIVAAIRSRNPVEARGAMHRHIDVARQNIIQVLGRHSLDVSLEFEDKQTISHQQRSASK
jgi:DNA-binding GntR family transcriptional regulator